MTAATVVPAAIGADRSAERRNSLLGGSRCSQHSQVALTHATSPRNPQPCWLPERRDPLMVSKDDGIGEYLASQRRMAGWSQEELAERSTVSVRTIRNLETGRIRSP